MARKYLTSPPGEAVHPWVNKPDTKFAPPGTAGVFKTGLKLSGAAAEKLAEEVDQEAQAAFDAYAEEKGFTAGEKKKWSVYKPYERLEDDDGNPTGEIVFDFKQNASIKMRSGEEIEVKIAIKDSKNNDIKKPVFSGSTIRVRYSFRPIPMMSLKQVGVRLDFAAIQVIKMADRTQGGGGFGEYEGGYVDEPGGDTGGFPESASKDGDY